MKKPLKSVPVTMMFLLTLQGLMLWNSAATAIDDPPWTLTEDEDGIKLYTRVVPDSPYHAVKATVTVAASPDRVAAAFGDGEGCAEWRAMCKTSKVLEVVSDRERYVYLVLDLPWPISDRDIVMRTLTDTDLEAHTTTVEMQSASSRHPRTDYVRAESSGRYVLRALSPEQVEITYIIHVDLGGTLSANMINPRLASSAIDDMERLRQLTQKE